MLTPSGTPPKTVPLADHRPACDIEDTEAWVLVPYKQRWKKMVLYKYVLKPNRKQLLRKKNQQQRLQWMLLLE